MIPAALVTAGVALAIASGSGPKNVVDVKSRVDGRTYRVQNLPDKQEAADRISTIRINLDKLIEYYKSDPSAMADSRVKIMVSRFNPNNFTENDLNTDTT